MTLVNEEDQILLEKNDIKEEEIKKQWEMLQRGFPKIQLHSAATRDNGIVQFNDEDKKKYRELFVLSKSNYDILKFVPASGAASRMFSPVRKMKVNAFSDEAQKIMEELESFPFYNDLVQKAKVQGTDIESLRKDPDRLADFLLSTKGMAYDNLPKGLVTFYTENSISYNAFQLQIKEAEKISGGKIEFSVNKDYEEAIRRSCASSPIQLSHQTQNTDYIAMIDGEIARNDDGTLLLRPSGHGALLHNLQNIDSEIVFIKNIDNIQAPAFNESSIQTKELIGGLLIDLLEKRNNYLKELERGKGDLKVINSFIRSHFDSTFDSEDKNELIQFLDRPMRVAAMVKNEGKAGGGPFWVESPYGRTLQIVEGAQIDNSDQEQMKILYSSTHFNPVDIACALKNHKGNPYILKNFVDEDMGFLSQKEVNGKTATIMERPGLWNGSMAHWLTVFVDAPIESFTPVKSLMDLLPK